MSQFVQILPNENRYTIVDGQPLNDNLTAISNLTGGYGFLYKTQQGSWILDTNTYAKLSDIPTSLPNANPFIFKINSGTLEGTSLYTYNGGATKTLDIKSGTNITFTNTNGSLTINSVNTTYTAGNGLTLTGTVFSLPVTVSGSGNYISDVTQTTNGITITKATLPTYTDTVTRLRGTTTGTYTSGDLTLLAGTNITISQSGANFTINSNFTNTTYTAGNGLTLTGTVFSLPVTVSGTGNFVSDVTQTASGITITKSTIADTITRLRGTATGTYTSGDLTLLAGSNITISQSGSDFTINSNFTNTTYTSSNGILLTGTNFTPVYGTTANTIAQGSDSRIINGQTAFTWGDHSLAGYLTSTNLTGYATEAWVISQAYSTTDTVTRLRGTATGTYTSGDLTLLAGSNITITQSGANFTINSNFTNTTYTAGNGLTLTGTVFSLPVVTTGTGTFVQSITQTTTGLAVVLGTPPNTTYSAGNGLTLTGTVFSLPVTISGSGNYVSDVTQTASGITITKATLPTYTDTVTRLRGTATGTYTSGDLTLLAGTNVTISQTGSNITINSNFTNTTYTAGNGILLTGTNFTPVYGTTTNTIAQGNDSRIINGQTAFTWGDHSAMGYLTNVSNASSTTFGLVKLFSDTVQTVAATAVSATASRTYGVQFNSSNQLVVNVPWVDTNTTYSGGTLAILNNNTNATNYLWSSSILNDWIGGKGFLTSVDLTGYATESWVLAQGYVTTDTVTRLRGTATGTYTSGDLTLLAGTNITISQTGSNITINSNFTNTTYSAGNGLTLTGTVFSLPVTVSGSGNYVSDVTQTASGITITKATLPTYTDTVTRLRGTTGGTFTSGDLTLLAGTNITISQSGANFTINSNFTNTTYTAGNGLTLTGTVFSLPVATSGSGNYVSDVIQTASGITITKATLPVSSLVTSTTATGVTNVVTTNTNTYLNIVENGASVGSSTQVTGTGSVTVSSNAAGLLTITGVNTTYTAGNGLTLSGTTFSLPVTISGSGNVVTDVSQNTNGITITKGTITDTVTRLRGTATGTYTSGDLTLLAGTNITISQTGSDFTINSNFTNTTYTAGNGLTLTGTVFSLPVVTTGTGTFVQSITQTTTGLAVVLGTPPNTTYSAGNGLTLTGTVFSLPVSISGSGNYVSDVTQTASGITITKATLPTYTDTVTRLRGTATGTYTSGDLTLLAGSNVTITQSGANFTINSNFTNTTYTAGNGLTLSGTVFSLPVTVSGSGNYISDVTQTASGITVTKATLPTAPVQNLSIDGFTAGMVNISNGGTSATLQHLGLSNRQDANVRALRSEFTPYLTVASGISNYPHAGSSVGIRAERFSGPTSQLGFDMNTSGAPGIVYLKTFSGQAGEGSWETIATREWSNSNYITTNTTQTGLIGDKTSSGLWTFGRVKSSRLGYFGTYSSAQTQGIWSIDTAYNVSPSTTTLGTQYGLAYSYIDVGGSSIGSRHQIHFVQNGISGITIDLNGQQVRAMQGFVKVGQNDTQILLAGGGHRPVSDFMVASDIPFLNSEEFEIIASHIVSGVVTIDISGTIYNNSAMVFWNGIKIPKSKITIQTSNRILITNASLLTPIIIGDTIEIEYLTK